LQQTSVKIDTRSVHLAQQFIHVERLPETHPSLIVNQQSIQGGAMKTLTHILFFAAALSVMLAIPLYAQNGNINNTLGTGGAFTVKDGAATFLTLSHATGYLGLNRSLTLPATTDATLGVIFKGASSFIHNYQAPETSGGNTFVGENAGNFTMSGSSNAASFNSALGYRSLSAITTAQGNSAFGYFSLGRNTAGNSNSAFGRSSLSFNTTGQNNSAFGLQSIYNNTTGSNNSAFGMNSLVYNTTGTDNSAFGFYSLSNNSAGNNNSAFGRQSLERTTGDNNTAFGFKAGSTITTGSNNIVVGADAQVPAGASDNQVRIGNSDITYASIEVAWTVTSDRRRKDNIHSLSSGLNFVSLLRPVSYTRRNDDMHRTEYGFIAQEVEQVLKDQGIQNSGMLTIDDKGFYELRYNDLLAPMVKAIQELKSENDTLKGENASMKKELSSLRVTVSEQIKEMRSMVLKIARSNATEGNVSSIGGSR
jgi:hypothetical protein